MHNPKTYAERTRDEEELSGFGYHFKPHFEPHFKSLLAQLKENTLTEDVGVEPDSFEKSTVLEKLEKMGITDPMLRKYSVDDLEHFFSLLVRFGNREKPDFGDAADLDKMKVQERKVEVYYFPSRLKRDWSLMLNLKAIGNARIEVSVSCTKKGRNFFSGKFYCTVDPEGKVNAFDTNTTPIAQEKPVENQSDKPNQPINTVQGMPAEQDIKEQEAQKEIAADKSEEEDMMLSATPEQEQKQEAPTAPNNEIYYEKVKPSELNRSGYVFKRQDGTPLSQDSVLKYIAKQKKAGNQEIIADFKMHVKGKNTPGTHTSFRIDNPPKGQIHNYGYSFDPDWNKEEEKKDDFFGVWQTSHAIVRMTAKNGEKFNGIRLHTTPDHEDKDYKNKKGNAATVYKPGERITIYAKGNDKCPGWVYIRTPDGRKGWIEEHWLTPIDKDYNVTYTLHQVKEGEGVEALLHNIGIDRTTGYDGRSFAVAFYKMNAGNPGVYLDMKKYEENRSLFKDIHDPWFAEARAIYQSVEIQAGAVLLVPTQRGVEQMRVRGELPTRPELVNDIIKGADMATGILSGIGIGMAKQAADMVTGIWDMIKSIFTGEILDQMLELYEAFKKMGWEDVKKLLWSILGVDPDEFDEIWNGKNVKEFTRYQYLGEIIGRLLFEIITTIVSGGAIIIAALGKTAAFAKVAKILTKVQKSMSMVNDILPPSVKNKIKKAKGAVDKAKEATIAPVAGKIKKVQKVFLSSYPSLTKKLDNIQKNVLGITRFEKFDKLLHNLSEEILEELNIDPDIMDDFARKCDKDPDFAKAMEDGKIDELKEFKEERSKDKSEASSFKEENSEAVKSKTWQEYEKKIQDLYGDKMSYKREFTVSVDGKEMNGVADRVAEINGKPVAIEAKFVKDDWSSSIRNPNSKIGSKEFAIKEQKQMLLQAKKYISAFGEAIYHTNSPELAKHYAKVFEEAGLKNIKFIVTP